MQVAIVQDGVVMAVGHYKEVFPSTCFPESGPNAEFMQEHGAKQVNMPVPSDHETQHLVPCEPYEDGDWVYTMKVVDK